MQIIPHLNLRLPFRLPKKPSSSLAQTTGDVSRRITPDPDSATVPPDPKYSEFEPARSKPEWQEYMETHLSEGVLEPNRIERGILGIIHKMFSTPESDEHAAGVATQEVREFYSHLYKKYVTQKELRAGAERLVRRRLEEEEQRGKGDFRGAGYFLEHAAGFVLEMAHLIDVADVNHERIFRFLEGFRGEIGRTANPKFIYDPKAIGRAAQVVWKYTCPSVRTRINPSRSECDGRMAFSCLLARLLSADLVPLRHAALLTYDIDLGLCPEFFCPEAANSQSSPTSEAAPTNNSQTENNLTGTTKYTSARGKLLVSNRNNNKPEKYIRRAREAIAARHILIAGPILAYFAQNYSPQREMYLCLKFPNGTVQKANVNIPDWKWKMWFYRLGKISVLARQRAARALIQNLDLDFWGMMDHRNRREEEEGIRREGSDQFSGGETDDDDKDDGQNEWNHRDSVDHPEEEEEELDHDEEEEEEDCDKGLLGQQRNLELQALADNACVRLGELWFEALGEEDDEVLVEEESDDDM